MPVSLSSSWSSGRHEDGYAMLAEAADLGFEFVELSHGIRMSLVPGVLKALEEKIVRPTSIHNFCPLPNGVNRAAPNLFRPSALDPEEHESWLRHTRRTLEFASRIEAQCMVTHLGDIPFLFFSPARKLESLRTKALRRGEDCRHSAAYQKALDKAQRRLRGKMPKYLKQVVRSVRKILAAAKMHGVSIGVENREDMEELPLDDSFGELFAEVSSSRVGYWHDAGHAAIKEMYGVIKHEDLLRNNAERLLGFHLHDVTPEGLDHRPLGTGIVDFDMLARYMRPEQPLVLEFHPQLTRDEVLASKAYLEGLLERRA